MSLFALTAPLLRDSDFQAAWYYSIVLFAVLVVTAWGTWWAIAPLRAMWRRGDRGMASAIAGAVGVTFLTFASMLLTVAIAGGR